METTTCPTHWTRFPSSSDTIRTIECDPFPTTEDGMVIPAGTWKEFEDFIFVGTTVSKHDAEVWRDARPEHEYDEVVGYNGNDGWGQQSEYV